MTVCGFATRDGIAWAWADGEAYRDDEPLPAPAIKLGVSPGGLVGFSTGYRDLSEAFRRTVVGFGPVSVDAAIRLLPEVLRFARARKIKRCRDLAIAYEPPTNFAVAGWSGDAVRGAVFYENRDFAAVEASAWLSPAIEAAPQSAADVLAIAQRQLEIVRRAIPDASGRDLTIAKIGLSGVVTTAVRLVLPGETAGRSAAYANEPRHEGAF